MLQRRPRRPLRVNIEKKIINSIAAGVTIAIVFLIFQYLNFENVYGTGSGAIIYASVGASAFILFVMPKSRAAGKRTIMVSYICAGVLGYLSYTLSGYFGVAIASAIAMAAVGSAMVLFKAEHPPAAGLALAFVLFRIDIYGVLLVISIGAVIIAVSYVLETFIKDVEKEV